MIEVRNMDLIYPNGKGVFDLDFTVKKGSVVGYLGPNGAGKTTTIRALLGFMQTNKGSCSINGLDCFSHTRDIQKSLGYIPGEIAFLEHMGGVEFIRFMSDMRGVKSDSKVKELCEIFEFNPEGKIKRFSKGMKQKLAIITAFLHDPEILILDEPSSGLDPLMQNRFVDLILQEKKRGKTILLSSHIFEEVERTCDDVIIIKDGYILNKTDISTLRSSQKKNFLIKTENSDQDFTALEKAGFDVKLIPTGGIQVNVSGEALASFFKLIGKMTITDFTMGDQSLETVFMQYYGKDGGCK
jgi:ABC-2 type transport system ATP-binding protein